MVAASFGRRGAPMGGLAQSHPVPLAPASSDSAEADDAEPWRADHEASAAKLLAYMPFVTIGLALFLCVIFGVERRLAFDTERDGSPAVDALIAFGAASYNLVVVDREWWRIFLAPLLHASFGHVLGNCFALVLVGYSLEGRLGRGWYGAIFAFSALTGVAGSLIGNPHNLPTVGASGAITGLIAALFVVSFHNSLDPVDRAAMQRMAIRFGLPALGPMLYQAASSGVDYSAHLGGAIGGGALAFVVTSIWTDETFRPPFARQARFGALFALFLSASSVFFAASHFSARAATLAGRIPTKALPDDLAGNAKTVADLVRRYPKDPRGHLVQALTLAKSDRLWEAETELRSAMALATDPRDVRIRPLAKTYLALIAVARGHRGEASELAKDSCASKDIPELRQILKKTKLCR